MLTHGVARLSSESHAACRELPWKQCGIMGFLPPTLIFVRIACFEGGVWGGNGPNKCQAHHNIWVLMGVAY
jgi:hypothetical protein